jgi:hypothetical protein
MESNVDERFVPLHLPRGAPLERIGAGIGQNDVALCRTWRRCLPGLQLANDRRFGSSTSV